MISILITLVVYILILGLLYWLVDYGLRVFPLPDPIPRVARFILIAIVVLVLIGLLLSLTGTDYGFPRFRVGGY